MTQLLSVPISSPGAYGLNTEDQDSVLDPKFSTVAYNCVVSRNGRLESREGWSKINGTAATGTPILDVVHSYITDAGVEILISTGGNKLWTGDTTLTDSTGALTVTANYWKFQNLEGKVIGVQAGHDPIIYKGSGDFTLLSAEAGSGGIVQFTECLAAFGRLWGVDPDGNTLRYSDLLIPQDFSGGSSGSIDLNSVWPKSNDTIIALATHNNNLIIIGKNNVVIYGSADDVSNIALVDIIEGIGCISRDSVQGIGEDLFWLSDDGIRSLGRTIIQDNLPLATQSSQVRTELINTVKLEGESLAIQSAYNESKGLYLLGLPTAGLVYVFDIRQLQQNIIKPFIWDSIEPYGMTTRLNGDLIFGFAGGFLGKYSTYLDNSSTYIMKFRSGWIDPGSNGMELIWKNMRIYLYSNYSLTTVGSWGYDFETSENTQTKSITATDVSEYNVSEYNIAEYGSGTTAIELSFDLTGTGELIRIGFQATINSGKVGLNKVTLQAKRGKVN